MIRNNLRAALQAVRSHNGSSRSARGDVAVRVVDSDSEFRELAPQWEELQRDALLTSVFETHDWQYLWWSTYGRGQPLRLLVATREGRLVGVLPLYIQVQNPLRYPVRVLRLVGVGGDTAPDDLGPVLARGLETEVAEAFVDTIAELPGWDVVSLTDLNADCPFTKLVASRLRGPLLGCIEGSCERISFIDLPGTWDAWLKTLHSDRRYRVRNIRKKLNAQKPAKFFVWEDSDTLNTGIDRLVELHRKRWQSAGRSDHAFASDDYVTFHRAVMNACQRKDRLRLYCLEVSGEIVAIYYFYRFRDTVYLMQGGFDTELSALKPGQVLLGYVIEHAIGEGMKRLDFLRGEHRYKEELASGQRFTVYVDVFRNTPGAAVYRMRRHVLPRVKAATRRVLARVRKESPPVEKEE